MYVYMYIYIYICTHYYLSQPVYLSPAPGHADEAEQDARGTSGTASRQQGADGEVRPGEDGSGESGEGTHDSAEHLDVHVISGEW